MMPLRKVLFQKSAPLCEKKRQKKYLHNCLFKVDNHLYNSNHELKTDMARTKETSGVS